MKIALTFGAFLPVPPALGGATEKIWCAIARRLVDRGHQVTAYSRRWSGWPDRETRDGVVHHRLPGRDHYPRLWQNLLLDLRWSMRLARVLPSDAFVISHNITLPILLRLPGLRHPAPIAVVLGRMPKGRLRAYRGLDRIYATSHAVAEQARAEAPRLEANLRVLPNAIDWSSFQSSTPRPAGPAVHLGFVGRIHPEKGIHLILEALALAARRHGTTPPWRLSIIGPTSIAEGGGGPEYLERLRRLASAPELAGRVEFLPPCWDAGKLAEFYRSIEIFIYPSLAEQGETFGVSVAEAMAAGAVPVVSRLACFGDLLTPGDEGLDFDHRATNATMQLADQLTALLTDPARRSALSAAARSAARRFDLDLIVDKLEADFATLPPAA